MRPTRTGLHLHILLAVLLLVFCVGSSLAVNTIGEEGPPPAEPAPAPEAEHPTVAITGGVYLFENIPTAEVTANSFEVYAFILRFDASTEGGTFGLHIENRIRDTKFRSFFTSNIWLQEAYAFGKLPFGQINLGKIYRKVGLFWDDSFFGNVHFFNGLKLNPDFGGELLGDHDITGRFSLEYSLQFFSNNDQVSGALPGRDVESDPNARLRNVITARLVPKFTLAENVTLTLGFSGMTGKIDRGTGSDFTIKQGAGDVSLVAGPVNPYFEVLRQVGEPNDAAHPLSRPGYDDATYILAGARWRINPVTIVRVNYSYADYDGANAKETELVPGIVFRIAQGLNFITEFNYWQLQQPAGGAITVIDRSLKLVINYNF
jgi:hypothetical protein